MEELSLYIHIPFCQRKCNYCDFLSFDNCNNQMDTYVDALVKQIRIHGSNLGKPSVKTLFIGGGTPSLLSSSQLTRIMDGIYKNFNCENLYEATIECNPGSITREKAKTMKELGLNRISMGLQSTSDEVLKKLGRVHIYSEFLNNYHMLRDLGFNNINIDLMYSLPGQTLEDWVNTLKQVIELKPEHISAYGLIIEEGTLFYELHEKGNLDIADEETERKMYWTAVDLLKKAGYIHYEISNFSRKGFECKHNLVYWNLEPYLGIGLGAASYLNGNRTRNTESMDAYLFNMSMNNPYFIEEEAASEVKKMEEFMFLGLRKINGIDKRVFLEQFGKDIYCVYGDVINKLINESLIGCNGDQIYLTDRGIDISNYVMAQFLLE